MGILNILWKAHNEVHMSLFSLFGDTFWSYILEICLAVVKHMVTGYNQRLFRVGYFKEGHIFGTVSISGITSILRHQKIIEWVQKASKWWILKRRTLVYGYTYWGYGPYTYWWDALIVVWFYLGKIRWHVQILNGKKYNFTTSIAYCQYSHTSVPTNTAHPKTSSWVAWGQIGGQAAGPPIHAC